MLPVGPINKVILDWLEKYDMTHEEFGEQVGISQRAVYRFVSGETKKITWELADQIITRTIGPLHWYTNPELRKLYLEADLHSLDLIHPIPTPRPQFIARW